MKHKILSTGAIILFMSLSSIAQAIKGLTVVVGYSNRSASTVSISTVTNMMNQSSGFTTWSNNGSVQEYWSTMSNGKVNLTQEVVSVTLDNPVNYYHAENLPYDGGQRLVDDVIDKINLARPNGFTGLTIRPNTDQLWCFNLLCFTGTGGGVAYGVVGNKTIKNNGVNLPIRNVATSFYSNFTPDINVICHELGHAVFGWGDYYNASSLTANNIGNYCVMGSGGNLGSAMPVSAPFRTQKGWVDNVIDITNASTAVYNANSNDYNQVYKYSNANNPSEYLLIEPLTHSKYYLSVVGDGYTMDQGLAIWYVDEEGGLLRSGMSNNFFVKLVQADGEDEMHDLTKTHHDHRGDETDLFGDIVKTFSASNTYFRWKDGSEPGLILENISNPASTMSFKVVKNRTIDATSGINGTLSSKGLLNVANGSNKTLQIIPDIGYINSNIQVNGSTLSGRSSYTFNNVQSNQSINATFTASSSVDVLPSPWSATNIGTHLNTSVSGYRNGSFGITSYGSDIWGNSDQFAFINQTLNGNGEIIARISDFNRINDWAKSGLMIRESLAANSKYFFFSKTGTQGFAPQYRTTTGGYSEHNGQNIDVRKDDKAFWLKVKRENNTFTAYYSFDGQTWVLAQTQTISMQSQVYIGLCASGAYSNTLANKTVFTNVVVNKPNTTNYLTTYNVPFSSSIPNGFMQFNTVYSLGSNGPNLSNVHNSVFNWWGNSGNPNGLYQFTLETTNGNPRYYSNLTDYASSYSLHTSNPEITFNSTGFNGLQGAYWVKKQNNDLILVAKDGSHAIVFTNTNSSARPGIEVSEEISELVCFPNPTQSAAKIQIPASFGKSTVKVFNLNGSLEFESKDVLSQEIVLGENLDHGTYIVEVIGEAKTSRLKLIKE